MDTLTDALAAIAAIRQRGHHKIVVKQALGLAGGNAIRLFEPELLENQRRWIANALANRRQLVVEPWLERVRDFSVQLEMTADGLKLCGYTGLINDAKGQFQGNSAAPKFERRIPQDVIGLFLRTAGHCHASARALRGYFHTTRSRAPARRIFRTGGH